jgi:hypothetical protein
LTAFKCYSLDVFLCEGTVPWLEFREQFALTVHKFSGKFTLTNSPNITKFNSKYPMPLRNVGNVGTVLPSPGLSSILNA